MNKNHLTPRGSIEGFFGQSWSWEERHQHLIFLAAYGYDFYIYAPKSDTYLRRHWHQAWPTPEFDELQKLRAHCQQLGLRFGVGLSPLEIHLLTPQERHQRLQQRMQQINLLTPDILCLLFDDMRGDLPQLAAQQIDLVHQAVAASNSHAFIFCPTYYSFDPVLEKVFGKMPEHYWRDLAQHLDKQIDMFWTGEKVCSSHYPQAHLQQVSELLGRKAFLWDNYPVNDGAVKSKHLHLRPVAQTHSQLPGAIAGHAVNPMNQPWLSQPAMASLALAYQNPSHYNPQTAQQQLLPQLCGKALATALEQDIDLFQELGLNHIAANMRLELIAKYRAFLPSPYARELIAWLEGQYQFDPACLTD